MNELDEVFDGKASQHYIEHVTQHWLREPYIGGSYSHYDTTDYQAALTAPIDNKIFFAGETYAPDGEISTVHGAGLSAYDAVELLLKNG
jgi:monoamine oxidase